jgi:hypothetical protein
MLALGHFEEAPIRGVEYAEINTALIEAKVFRRDSQAFLNLSLYEQRLQRTQKEALRQLQELQAKRIAARQAALDEAVALRNLYKMKAQPFEVPAGEFVFSTAQIELEATRQERRTDVQKAKSCGYDPAKYREFPIAQAA